MRVWPNVECRTTLPDDQIDEGGEIVHFPGENVADVVGELLATRGYEVSPVESAGDHGWDFEARREGQRFWLEVAVIDEATPIIQTEHMRGGFSSAMAPYEQFLTDLHEALTADPRFRQIRWWTGAWPIQEGEASSVPFDKNAEAPRRKKQPRQPRPLRNAAIACAGCCALFVALQPKGTQDAAYNSAIVAALVIWPIAWFSSLRRRGEGPWITFFCILVAGIVGGSVTTGFLGK